MQGLQDRLDIVSEENKTVNEELSRTKNELMEAQE